VFTFTFHIFILTGALSLINIGKNIMPIQCKNIQELCIENFDGLLFDIDDTFTTDGKVTSKAFESLWNISKSGLKVIPVTGRPAGWCDHIARMWPVTGVIGENGAF
jgi:hypothetical protein